MPRLVDARVAPPGGGAPHSPVTRGRSEAGSAWRQAAVPGCTAQAESPDGCQQELLIRSSRLTVLCMPPRPSGTPWRPRADRPVRGQHGRRCRRPDRRANWADTCAGPHHKPITLRDCWHSRCRPAARSSRGRRHPQHRQRDGGLTDIRFCRFFADARGPLDWEDRLAGEPTVTGSMAARPRSLDELRGEPPHSPVDADVVNGDTAVGQQLPNIPVGQPVSQIPADRGRDHLGWEPQAGEDRSRRTRGHRTGPCRPRPASAAVPLLICGRTSCRAS